MNRITKSIYIICVIIASLPQVFCQDEIIERVVPALLPNAGHYYFYPCKFLNDDLFYLKSEYVSKKVGEGIPRDIRRFIVIMDKDLNIVKQCEVEKTLPSMMFDRDVILKQNDDGTYFFSGISQSLSSRQIKGYTFDKDFKQTATVSNHVLQFRTHLSSKMISEKEVFLFSLYSHQGPEAEEKGGMISCCKTDTSGKKIVEKAYSTYLNGEKQYSMMYNGGKLYMDNDSNIYTISYHILKNNEYGYERYKQNGIIISKDCEKLEAVPLDSFTVKIDQPEGDFRLYGINAWDFILDKERNRIYTARRLNYKVYRFEYWDTKWNKIWSKTIDLDTLHNGAYKKYWSINLGLSVSIIGKNGELIIGGDITDTRWGEYKDYHNVLFKLGTDANVKWFKEIKNGTEYCPIMMDLSKNSRGEYIANCHRIRFNGTPQGEPMYNTIIRFTDENSSVENIDIINQDIKVSPMPVNEDFEIKFRNSVAGMTQLRITNSIGEEILTKEYEMGEGEQSINVNLSTQAAGLYICQIRSGNEVFIKQIIKQ